MPNDTVTLALAGEVPIPLFADAMRHFNGLVEALSSELVRRDAIDWLLDDQLPVGITTTLHAEPKRNEYSAGVERVVRAYADVGQRLERNESLLYSPRVVKEAQGIVSLLDSRIRSVRFETAEADATIVSPSVEHMPKHAYLSAYGAIEGTVQTVTSRRGLRFVLYDSVYDQAVSCYLIGGQEELMRDVWGHRALVEGWVSRDPLSGRPVTIRRITNIRVMNDVIPGSYLEARGILPSELGELAPEERIRRARRMSWQVRDAR